MPKNEATDLMVKFMEKGAADPGFAPVHLTASLSNVSASSLSTELVRGGVSMWEEACHGEMQGLRETYPKIDLRIFPWKMPRRVSFKRVRNGFLLGEMHLQLAQALAELPFSLQPVDDAPPGWRDSIHADKKAYFKLVCKDAPLWITGLDTIRMSGSWKVFLPQPLDERALIDKLLQHEHIASDLARLRAQKAISLTESELRASTLVSEVDELKQKLQIAA